MAEQVCRNRLAPPSVQVGPLVAVPEEDPGQLAEVRTVVYVCTGVDQHVLPNDTVACTETGTK
jgi:hypothetical protein